MRIVRLSILSLAAATTVLAAPPAHAGIGSALKRVIDKRQTIRAAAKDFDTFIATSTRGKATWKKTGKLADKKHLGALTFGWVGMGGGGAALTTWGLANAASQPGVMTAVETFLGAREMFLAAKHLPAAHADYRRDRQRARAIALHDAKKDGIAPTAAQLSRWRAAGLVAGE